MGHPQGNGDIMSSVVSWRKLVLLNRSALLSAWPRYFPQHSFSDLRLISSNPADSYWEGEDWKRAARAYHQERRQLERMR
jgi:hypothetical protein